MVKLYLVKIGEIFLKGGNRIFFEKQLKNNIKKKLKKYGIIFFGRKGRYFIEVENPIPGEIEDALSKTFGVTGYCECLACEKNIEIIIEEVLKIVSNIGKPWNSFKIDTRRTDKSFHLSSYQISCALGDAILYKYPEKTVLLTKPDITINIEIRENAIIYENVAGGLGGLPVGSAGKGLLMLSGGIDSPVAGYLMAKRGLRMDAVYFHAYPYTGDEAKEKVISLAKIIAPYLCGLRLFIIPFTKTQIAIKSGCLEEEITIHMRSAMVRICHFLLKKYKRTAIVTGEALSQVASQTVESLRITDNASDYPILRPLIGMDKEEIIAISKKINAYETSILPYDDCCSLFSPRHPLTRPDYIKINEKFNNMELKELLIEAAENAEILQIPQN